MNKSIQKLTKAEEEIMQIIWQLEKTTVSEIISKLKGEKPPHSTISSIVRILEKKGFVNHKAYGRTYEYFPVIKKDSYSKYSIKNLVKGYFEGSTQELVSFLVKEEEVDLDELKTIINNMNS